MRTNYVEELFNEYNNICVDTGTDQEEVEYIMEIKAGKAMRLDELPTEGLKLIEDHNIQNIVS